MEEEKKINPSCFVIQYFDKGKYDRRYNETIKPALVEAEVDPQRADEILGLNPVISKIEDAIKSASICIAEVSEDNPNVWLELGYALALNRPTVILCDESRREKLPFNIQHRPVIFYRTDSSSGFEDLKKSIIECIKSELSNSPRVKKIQTLKSGSENKSDLKDYEIEVLSAAFAFWPATEEGISYWELKQSLEKLEFTEVALALGVSTLTEKGLLSEKLLINHGYNAEEYKAYFVTDAGIQWLHQNEEVLTIKQPKEEPDDPEDDIPY